MSTATLAAAILRCDTQNRLDNEDVAYLVHVIEKQTKPVTVDDNGIEVLVDNLQPTDESH